MLLKRQRGIPTGILLVYLAIISTFELAHKDYISLGGTLRISPLDGIVRSTDVVDGFFVCPAHNFSGSAHGPAATSQVYIASTNVTFFQIEKDTEPPIPTERRVL